MIMQSISRFINELIRKSVVNFYFILKFHLQTGPV